MDSGGSGFYHPDEMANKKYIYRAIDNEGNEQNVCLYAGKCAELHFSRTSGKQLKTENDLDEAFSQDMRKQRN